MTSNPSDVRTVLITGASTGFGKLAALTIARSGHEVYASMRDTAGRNREPAGELNQIARDEGLRLRVVELDVTVNDSVQAAVKRILADSGRLDVLVNNAGHMAIGITEAFTEEQSRQQMEVNFFGPVRLCRAVLPHMRQRRAGLLVHVTSVAGRVLFPACGFYCASKFALEAYAEVLHYELTGFGVDSVLVEPGPYPTRLLANSPGPADQDRVNSYERISSIREMFSESFRQFFASDQAPDPQEVADAILRLIQTPAGKRPLRTVCGPDYGAIAINRQIAPIQADVLRALGMDAMVKDEGGLRESATMEANQ
ncbi:MAG: SDR family oxidoreductase [Acidobacteriota bacterium]|nr:SDR family oxidoreductase [Acidobacteriota bacterium]